MVSRQIIQFKCVVSLCDQDFGAFCRERDPKGKKRFGEQPGATKPVAEEVLEALVEVDGGFGAVEWRCWMLGTMLEAGGWLVGLRSLLGWLWWHWVFWFGTECIFALIGGRSATSSRQESARRRTAPGPSQRRISAALSTSSTRACRREAVGKGWQRYPRPDGERMLHKVPPQLTAVSSLHEKVGGVF